MNLAWIFDTDLCVVVSSQSKFAVVNFMDGLNTDFPIYGSQGSPDAISPNVVVWKDKKVFLVPDADSNTAQVFTFMGGYPCGGLCDTCLDIWRFRCGSCKPNAVKDPADSTTCSCKTRYYQSKISRFSSECLDCHQLCETCSNGSSTGCLTCRYPLIMEKKADGSCGCPEGSFLEASAASCGTCHSSCVTCSGGSDSECSSCRQAEGRYLSADGRCLSCHPSYKTCSGGSSNQCLSCPPVLAPMPHLLRPLPVPVHTKLSDWVRILLSGRLRVLGM